MQSGGLPNPSWRDKTCHTREHKGSQVLGWASKATPKALVLFNTRALHAPLPWEVEIWRVIFCTAGGLPHCTSMWRQQLVDLGLRLPSMHELLHLVRTNPCSSSLSWQLSRSNWVL